MVFGKHKAECYVPDGIPSEAAMDRATIAAVGAHPDDLEIMALSGILEARRLGGKRFLGIVATPGSTEPRTGVYSGLSYDDLREIRRDEQRLAADIGDYSGVVQLMYESREVKDPREAGLFLDLKAIFERTRPEAVYLHNPFDRHDTHVAVCLRSLQAIRAASEATGWLPGKVYGCASWRGLDWLVHHDRIALPIHDPDHLSEQLIHAYKSQYAQDSQFEAALRGRRIVNAIHQESHALGLAQEVDHVMDMMPLVRAQTLDMAEYMGHVLHHFEQDALERVARFTGKDK